MALPVILVNSATGSDTAASGAGPSTALTGSAGITSASGLVVTLDGSPDLTNVATDGSHVLFMSDTNAGSRNFGKITAKANSGTPTAEVTVADAFQALNTDAWAIGGKRASIGSTTSKKLFDNNSAAGDAMPGWIVEMESGHTETLTATYQPRRSGDATDGPIVLRGTPGAGTLPVLTCSNNGTAFAVAASAFEMRDFEMRNSNATKTASVGFVLISGGYSRVRGLKMAHATDRFWKFMTGGVRVLEDSEIANCVGTAVAPTSDALLIGNWIHDNDGVGVIVGGGAVNQNIIGNLITNNGGDGLDLDTNSASAGVPLLIWGNTIDGNSGDGIDLTRDAARITAGLTIANNIISNNGGYGINFSGGSVNSDLTGNGARFLNNAFYNNTSGSYSITPTVAEGTQEAVDPQFVNAAGGNYAIGTNLKAKGYPLAGTLPVGRSPTVSFVDIGAAQREEPVLGSITRGIRVL